MTGLLRIRSWQTGASFAAAFAALALLPVLVESYTLRTAVEIMVYAMLAMSLNLILGQTGLPSMGHAAFYGAGAYAAGYVAKKISAHLLLTLSAAVGAAAVAALLVGFLAVRAAGIYFLMLTLAFGQMMKAVAHSWTAVTGGPDGLSGIPRPQLWEGLSLYTTTPFYYLSLIVFAAVFLFLWQLAGSPLGRSFKGIRENERRMRALGYDSFRYKLAAFVIGGAMAGLAGGMHAHLSGFASETQLDWSTSAVILVMVIIGGQGSLIGSIFGAALFVLIQHRLSSLTPYWHLYLGLLFIAFVLLSRQGLSGLARSLKGGWLSGELRLRAPLVGPEHELRGPPRALEHKPENSGG